MNMVDAHQHAASVLQAAITEAVMSGDPKPFDADAFKLMMREKCAAISHNPNLNPDRKTLAG